MGFSVFVVRALLGFASLVVSHALFIAAHGLGWYPDHQLATVLTISPSTTLWSLSAILAVAIWLAADWLLYRRHHKLPSGKIASEVSQELVKNLKSEQSSPIAERDTKVDRALAFIETGNWDHTYGEFMGFAYANKGSSFGKFRQAALDGKFRVWGKSGPHSPYHLIDKDYWNIWKLEVLSCVDGECKTEVAVGMSRVEKRYDLMVSKIEIEQTWPPKK